MSRLGALVVSMIILSCMSNLSVAAPGDDPILGDDNAVILRVIASHEPTEDGWKVSGAVVGGDCPNGNLCSDVALGIEYFYLSNGQVTQGRESRAMRFEDLGRFDFRLPSTAYEFRVAASRDLYVYRDVNVNLYREVATWPICKVSPCDWASLEG